MAISGVPIKKAQALNRCIACVFSVMVAPGTFMCTWKTRDSPLSEGFIPTVFLPEECSRYRYKEF